MLFWKHLLAETLGWTEPRFLEWLSIFSLRTALTPDVFFSKPPSHYILHLLIPDMLVENLEIDWFRLRKQMQEAIDNCGDYSSPDFDYKAAKDNIVKVLAEYGATLPTNNIILESDAETSRGNKPWYLRFWLNLLQEILGWSKPEFMRWARQHKKGLNGKDIWFYHEPPAWYVAPLFVPKQLSKKLDGMKLHKLHGQLQRAIEQGGHESTPDFDFQDAKRRVEKILSQFEETLPK